MAETKTINCFGFDKLFFGTGFDKIEPYQMKKVDNTVYMRFTDANPCAIIKAVKDSDGTITQTWTYGDFSQCTSLTDYIPINDLKTITVE